MILFYSRQDIIEICRGLKAQIFISDPAHLSGHPKMDHFDLCLSKVCGIEPFLSPPGI